jgi:hypothetical protein
MDARIVGKSPLEKNKHGGTPKGRNMDPNNDVDVMLLNEQRKLWSWAFFGGSLGVCGIVLGLDLHVMIVDVLARLVLPKDRGSKHQTPFL